MTEPNSGIEQDDPYEGAAENYAAHHEKSLRTRFTTMREQAVLRKAMETCSGIESVLDLPCGTGRFWPVFEQLGVKKLIAGDMSRAMLLVAKNNPPDIADFDSRQMDAFSIDLEDNAVDFISCQRFLHHISNQSDRQQALSELHRVSRSYVAASLWVDGNFQSRRYVNRPINDDDRGYGRRICRNRVDIEAEFRQSGFEIVSHQDVWPFITMWRLYLLRVA